MKTVGLVISGYPGIGKTTLAKSNFKYIDLDSSMFRDLGEDWHQTYCKIACELAKQGRYVFVSSHLAVRELLAKMSKTPQESEDTIVWTLQICPALSLKEEWTQRLCQRYLFTKADKDKRAMTAHDTTDMLKEMLDSGLLDTLVLDLKNYDLDRLIERYVSMMLKEGDVILR